MRVPPRTGFGWQISRARIVPSMTKAAGLMRSRGDDPHLWSDGAIIARGDPPPYLVTAVEVAGLDPELILKLPQDWRLVRDADVIDQRIGYPFETFDASAEYPRVRRKVPVDVFRMPTGERLLVDARYVAYVLREFRNGSKWPWLGVVNEMLKGVDGAVRRCILLTVRDPGDLRLMALVVPRAPYPPVAPFQEAGR